MNFNTPVNMGKISYINAAPIYYGLDHGLLPPWLKMVTDVPSALNRQIMTGHIKLSPISAAFYAQNHRDLLLLPDLSISCNGRVLSVILASHYPIDDLDGKTVLFSRESASAASFLKMIFNQKKIKPVYEIGAVEDCTSLSKITQAVLVIGDTSLVQPWDKVFEYCIDLGQLWYEMTQSPFVFAVWAVRRSFAKKHSDIVKKIHQLLLASKSLGDKHLDQVIGAAQKMTHLEESIIKEYFELLHCDLDAKKITAMQLFFNSLLEQGILSEKPDIDFFHR
ncbi:MAG: menaquinone biosynthesis protein [Pseudomonadota bacterium]